MSTVCSIHKEGSTCTCKKMPMLPPLSWIVSRPLRHCHRRDKYKNAKDLPLNAYCMCGECEPPSRPATEEVFHTALVSSVTGPTRLRPVGSSNSLEIPEFVPPKRTDSLVGLALPATERLKQE